MAGRRLRENKTPRRGAGALTLSHSRLPPSSLLNATGREKREQRSAAAAGPLVGAHARPRLSAPPSSGLSDGALIPHTRCGGA